MPKKNLYDFHEGFFWKKLKKIIVFERKQMKVDI
jgi:hypothetical protein